jgi:predicted PurR-regulated permease PerM
VFLAVSGGLLLVIVVVFHPVLVPFLLAVLVAYLLAPVVAAVERVRVRKKKLPRWAAVLVVYLVLLGVLGGAIGIAVPRLIAETTKLAHEAPRLAERLRVEVLPRIETAIRGATASYLPPETEAEPQTAAQATSTSIRVVPVPGGGFEVHLPASGIDVEPAGEGAYRVSAAGAADEPPSADLTTQLSAMLGRAFNEGSEQAATLISTLQAFVRGVFRGIFVFSMMLMISAYLLITSDRIFDFFRSLVRPDRQGQFDDLLRRIDRGLAGVVRGQLMICVVNGVLSAIGFYIAGLAYWPVLALIATVLSIIPIFGAFLSSVPAVAIGLQQGIGVSVFVLVWIIGIHQIEANLLNPKIMGDAAKVHPVLIIFALLAGEHFFGFIGALLAVPTLSILQSLFLHFRMIALGIPASSTARPTDPSPVR